MSQRVRSEKPQRLRMVPFADGLALVVILSALFALTACSDGEDEQAQVQPEPTGLDQRIEELQTRVTKLEAEIAEKQAAVDELRRENEMLEERFPKPHRVTAGQNHWQISFDFLTEEKGLGSEEAEQKLADAHLFHPVVEGFETWNFFDGETFGSFVTQDDAPVSPGALMRRREAEAEETEARMRSEIADLKLALRVEKSGRTAEVERLQSELDARIAESESLRSHIDALEQHREQLTARLEDLRKRFNSVYYVAGTETELRAQGKIEKPFLDIGGMRLGKLDSEDFENDVDLRDAPEIELQAEDFELDRIGDVAVLPDRWKKNRDYEVRIAGDGSSATVHLLRPDQFRLKTVVFVVGS